MGLGIFIARTLLQRTGAGIAFDNGPAGGARVQVSWDRSVLAGAARNPPAGETGP